MIVNTQIATVPRVLISFSPFQTESHDRHSQVSDGEAHRGYMHYLADLRLPLRQGPRGRPLLARPPAPPGVHPPPRLPGPPSPISGLLRRGFPPRSQP